MNKQEVQQEALSRAIGGLSTSNFGPIITEFAARGIPIDDIKPRENVFTYQAWLALKRQVRKGEHGVKVLTFVRVKSKFTDKETEGQDVKRGYSRPWSTTVFHISQTDAIN